MKELFSKTRFPESPGGNIYHFKEADTVFEIERDGKYVISITASAKNAAQNNSTDDDDLRVIIDDYEFGKYEVHDEEVSWKGFGTSASLDGASLKGTEKTIYFFLELMKGKHTIKFIADETPTIKEITVSKLEEGEVFEVEKLRSSDYVKTDKKGIPFFSFIFLGIKPKDFSIASTCKSAMQKDTSDGDNLKVVVNGKIVQNKKAPTSDKFKNFYFSGDLNKGQSEVLNIKPESFEFLEDSVELWYDESPSVYVKIDFSNNIKSWLENVGDNLSENYYNSAIFLAKWIFKKQKYQFAEKFINHSLNETPEKLKFIDGDSFVENLKKNKGYEDVLSLIQREIKSETLDGQIKLGKNKLEEGNEVNFENGDLFFSLHGLKKIDFVATKKSGNTYDIDITLLDVYDFDQLDYKLGKVYKWWIVFGNNQVDKAEAKGIVKNFEIEININDTITLN